MKGAIRRRLYRDRMSWLYSQLEERARQPNLTIEEVSAYSSAISLKRIADRLDENTDQSYDDGRIPAFRTRNS